MRSAPLTTVKGGINRLRLKGGARADSLYDLVNGFVTEQDTVVSRPGTLREETLDSSTRGLCTFGGELWTFCHQQVSVPAGYNLAILVHPDAELATYADPYAYYGIALDKIHFAEPFMGAIFVVAEFEDGEVYYYWLQEGATWEANKVYQPGDIVAPSTPTGIMYQASRLGSANPAWAPNVQRTDGTGAYYDPSVIEPTVYNGFYYTCVSAQGVDPRSGATEPVWPTEDGATVTEYSDNGADAITIPAAAAPAVSSTALDSATLDRYGAATIAGLRNLLVQR